MNLRKIKFTVAIGMIGMLSLPALAEEEARIFPNIVYSPNPGRDLCLDVIVPAGVEKPPLVVYIHGGGWRGGTRKNQFAKSLADHGFAVARIDYRFSNEAKFPAQIHDCKGAVRWLRAHSEKFGYDPSRIAAVGESAGAQLAVLLGTSGGVAEVEGDVGGNADQSSSVQAVVDYFGATDFLLRSRTQPEEAETPGAAPYELFGGPVSANEELARLASGALFASEGDAPLLAIHGDKDDVVLIDQSRRIIEAYKEQELDAQLIVVPDSGHFGNHYFSGEIKDSVVGFLKKHLQPQLP